MKVMKDHGRSYLLFFAFGVGGLVGGRQDYNVSPIPILGLGFKTLNWDWIWDFGLRTWT